MRNWQKASDGGILRRAGHYDATSVKSPRTTNPGDNLCGVSWVISVFVATGTTFDGIEQCDFGCTVARSTDCEGSSISLSATYNRSGIAGGPSSIALMFTLHDTGGWQLLLDGTATDPKFMAYYNIKKFRVGNPENNAAQFCQATMSSPNPSPSQPSENDGPTPWKNAIDMGSTAFAAACLAPHGRFLSGLEYGCDNSLKDLIDCPTCSGSHRYLSCDSLTSDIIVAADATFNLDVHVTEVAFDGGQLTGHAGAQVFLPYDPKNLVVSSGLNPIFNSGTRTWVSGVAGHIPDTDDSGDAIWHFAGATLKHIGTYRLAMLAENTSGYYTMGPNIKVTPGTPFALAPYAADVKPNNYSPPDQLYNGVFTFKVGVYDKYGNFCNTATNPVTLSLTATPPYGVPPGISGPTTVNAVAGIATFNVTLQGLGYSFTLGIASPGLIGLYHDVRPSLHLDSFPLSLDMNLKLISCPTACRVGENITVKFGIADANGVVFQPSSTVDPLIIYDGPHNGSFSVAGTSQIPVGGVGTFIGSFPAPGSFDLDLSTSYDTYTIPGAEPITPRILVSP